MNNRDAKKLTGKSKDVKQAREILKLVIEKLDAFNCSPPTITSTINWGPKKRGQGKRSGGTIKGSMSAAPYGIKTYFGVDISEYLNDFAGDMKWLLGNGCRMCRYYKARKFGCNQIEARLYAML